MNNIRLKNIYIFSHKYYQFLQLANEGDIRPFIRFIADCTEKTLDLYLWATSDLVQQIPMFVQTESELANIDKLVTPIRESANESTNDSTTDANDLGSGDIS